MEETAASPQTETTALEKSRTSRTKRSIIDNSSDNDEEYATSGFYVREKPDKSDKNSDESSNDSIKDKKEECIENGASNDGSEQEVKAEEDAKSKDGKNNEGQEDAIDNGSNADSANEDAEVDKNEGEDKSNDDNNDDASNHSEKEQETADSASPKNDNDKEEKKSDKNTVEEDDKSENNKDDAAADSSKKQADKADDDNSKESENQDSDNEEKEKKSETNDCSKNDSAEPNEEDKDKDKKVTETDESKSETGKGSDDGGEEGEDMEVEVDFDPSLLCPDISMDVDEQPVVTGSADGSSDDLLVARTTDVDEITGAEVTFNLTPEEMDLRSRMYTSDNPVQFTKIHCTACNVHLGSALDGQANRFVHPLLKVLICKKCYHFYTSGDFEKDEDGSELYCRWCGQGGEVLCCSSCEFVFCKRCIKNNFGMKKFKEIRNSDDWNCFRCNMTQLQALRASCAEFWDYYRSQLTLAKASSITETDPSFVTTDHTKCCQDQKNKDQSKSTTTTRKRKRKNSGEDPDFVPGMLEEPKKKPFIPPNAVPTSTPGILVIRPTASSTTTQSRIGPGTNTPIGGGQMFRVGNTTFRPRAPTTGNLGYTITRPKVSSSSTGPGYIKILPQKTTQATPRSQAPYTIIPPSRPSTSTRPTFTTIRPQNQAGKAPLTRAPLVNTVPSMKHEWFEKTVRAAARVNSNLSYTLTQLNRQQSQASSVESLAVVHNKLQEVLSTSINSLIQIRKNLRTEFIAGIKNIKFPPKVGLGTPPPMVPLSSRKKQPQSDDDDVIILSPPGSPTRTSSQSSNAAKAAGIVLGSGVSLTSISKNKSPAVNKPSGTTTSTPSKSLPVSKGGGYLKVKSFSALQSVPAECITIPDDPPAASEDNPGSVADPLEFCQVDMNEDENSNQSQQSQTSSKADDKKIKEKSPDTTKAIDDKKTKDDSKKEIKKEENAKEDVENNKNSSDEKDSDKMDTETKEDEKEASTVNEENIQDKPEKIQNDEDNKNSNTDKSKVGKENESSQEKPEQISDDEDNKKSGTDNSKVDKEIENTQDKSKEISDDEEDRKSDTNKSKKDKENENSQNKSEVKSDDEDNKKSDTDESKVKNKDKEHKDEKNDNHSKNQGKGENEADTNDESTEKETTENGDAKSISEVEDEEESESDRLGNFVYNTTEEPSAEVKKWLGAKVVMKKSRVVDELVRVKNRVLNGDSDGS